MNSMISMGWLGHVYEDDGGLETGEEFFDILPHAFHASIQRQHVPMAFEERGAFGGVKRVFGAAAGAVYWWQKKLLEQSAALFKQAKEARDSGQLPAEQGSGVASGRR